MARRAAKDRDGGGRGGARVGAGRPRDDEADGAILGATLDLLERHGYAGLSIDAVATAAGVAKTTIYRRWPSKTALLAAAALPFYGPLAEPPDLGDVRAELLQLLDSSRAMMTGRGGRILGIVLRASGEHAELQAPLQEALYCRRRLYYRVLNRAIASGQLRADIDQDLVTDLLLGPLWVRGLVTPSPMPAELVAQVVDGVLDGLRPR